MDRGSCGPWRFDPTAWDAELAHGAVASLDMTEPIRLAEAWRSTLASLGADLTRSVLLGGRNVERVALEMGAPIREAGEALVVVGEDGVDIPATAHPSATGLPDGSVDAVAMLAAWDGGVELRAVAREAARVVRPGGRVWLADLDAEALMASTPTAYPAALLYQARRDIGMEVLRRHEGSGRLSLAAMGAELQPVVASSSELPWAAFSGPGEYVEAVRSGAWPGTEMLGPDEMESLLVDLSTYLKRVRFPSISFLPWLLVRGQRNR